MPYWLCRDEIEELEELANETLSLHSDRMPVRAEDILRRLGVRIEDTVLDDKIEASFDLTDFPYCLYLNKRWLDPTHVIRVLPKHLVVAPTVPKLKLRRRFTMAHEVCHFLKDKGILHREYASAVSESSSGEIPTEAKANRFASMLLMPRDHFQQVRTQYLQGESVPEKYGFLVELSKHYWVSWTSCIYRHFELLPTSEVNGLADLNTNKIIMVVATQPATKTYPRICQHIVEKSIGLPSTSFFIEFRIDARRSETENRPAHLFPTDDDIISVGTWIGDESLSRSPVRVTLRLAQFQQIHFRIELGV